MSHWGAQAAAHAERNGDTPSGFTIEIAAPRPGIQDRGETYPGKTSVDSAATKLIMVTILVG